ncbi:D-2-hydroxyacid dehydrogenase [Bifidobacterium asteroides]|uniref:D-2-hydroxyacid dehydrogenase n=1 Tax=Bifidobacterium asteroides TaxID=1684 RepID=A0A318MFL3_9BIFI|nr:D-2-hydroxyacid dehydrogenase [Bifidobacterium asteroides]PXY82731.1 D-2-hydroxyacid dehydrogenase [Bifidobacterium asteroides]
MASKNNAGGQIEKHDGGHPGDQLIVNCLPLDQGERQEFLQAAPGIRQVFMVGTDMRQSMQWPMGVPQSCQSEATIILGNPPTDQVAACRNLVWLQTSSAGVDAYLKPGVLSPDAMLTSASGAYGQSVSEHMFAMMWTIMKDLPGYRDNQRMGRWQPRGAVLSPRGCRVLVLGTGDIGASFARLSKAVGARTIGIRRHPDQPVEGFDRLAGFDDLDALLPDVDVVALALPSTPQTRHIIDGPRLEMMKSTAVLINAGRGDAVDCMALAQALDKEDIFGAGLDVTEPEPLPENHPLWSQPRCLLTPHVAGGAHLASNVDKILEICLDNLRRFMDGRPLRNRMR